MQYNSNDCHKCHAIIERHVTNKSYNFKETSRSHRTILNNIIEIEKLIIFTLNFGILVA